MTVIGARSSFRELGEMRRGAPNVKNESDDVLHRFSAPHLEKQV